VAHAACPAGPRTRRCRRPPACPSPRR
jgi:hypothetical protein